MTSAARPISAGSEDRQDEVVFDALLQPACSLSPRGFVILMSAVCAVSFAAGLAFYLMGAWPVVGFLGLDVLLIWGAFKISFRRARRYEAVRLTREVLEVRKVDSYGRVRSWHLQPAWLRVEIADPPRHESQLRLTSHGRSLVIGSFLSPEERLDFARALRGAIETARAPHVQAS